MMSGASCLHSPLPATNFLRGLGQVTCLPWASASCHCKRWGISSLHSGAGETGMLQGRGDGTVRFLRFVLQGQSNRKLGITWIQKWKLFNMLKLFQETKILSKIFPLYPPQKTLQLNSATTACKKISLVFLLQLFWNMSVFSHFILKLKLHEHLHLGIKQSCFVNINWWTFGLFLSHVSQGQQWKKLKRYGWVGYKEELGFRIYQFEWISGRSLQVFALQHKYLCTSVVCSAI